jgi:ubiquinol-cytochrome c reductase cytochrome b subunit
MASGKQREPFDNAFVEWIDSRLPIFTVMQKEYGVFPTPRNFNYFWNFGAIATVMLVLMIVTGIVLAMYYTPDSHMAFGSVEHIMRDINWGWMVRYMHMNGATFFFLAVYIHIFRGLYYGSYKKPRELLWILGVVIFLLMMATAFMGYVLPWSQMGGWAATVITNLFSAIPYVGDSILALLWGGPTVDNPTLHRFFALHYLMPFVIVGVVGLHVWALHIAGSNNPLGVEVKGPQDTLPFSPYYAAKDTFGLSVFLLLYVIVTFWFPNAFAHPDHFVEFDPMKTPPHIVPEWYFLPFYAVLRSFTFGVNIYVALSVAFAVAGVWHIYQNPGTVRLPGFSFTMTEEQKTGRVYALLAAAGLFILLGYFSQFVRDDGAMFLTLPFGDIIFLQLTPKLCGVLAMFGSVILLAFVPWLDFHPVRSARFRPLFGPAVIVLALDVILLGYVGSQAADAVVMGVKLLYVGQLATGFYLAFFLVLLPLLSWKEKALPLPQSINEAVLAEKGAH